MPVLNELTEFDRVVYSDGNGNVTPAEGVLAPELYDDELCGEGWDFFTYGHTGQYGYNGPIMHSSEYIGGRLERDILTTRGYFVALVSSYSHHPDCDAAVEPNANCNSWLCEAESYIEGWAIAYRETPEP